MRVRIKLRQQGLKYQPKWWLVIQPCKKNLKGKYIENIGVWQVKERRTVKRHIAINTHRANYWLSVGATPTKGAHRVLSRFGLLPPLPPRFGTTHSYEKPERTYHTTYFSGHGKQKFGVNQVAFHYKQKLQEQMNLVERKRRLAYETVNNAGSPTDAVSALDNDAENTDDIDSDEPEIFERKRKFEKVLKKFNKHRDDKMIALRGNDLRYNVYLKKLEKLSRKDLGLDVAAYKDYCNNLKEFAHINKDLNIFAAESLAIGAEWTEQDNLTIIHDKPSQPEIQTHLQGVERVNANSKSIHFSLAKFLRTNSGFISARDHRAVKELNENMSLYLLNEPYLCDQLNRVYRRRKAELNEQDKQRLMLHELLEQEVPAQTLEAAEVSLKEFREVKMLMKFDKDIFARESDIHQHNDLEQDAPYSFFVNFDRLPSKIPEKIKQLLYRPERMARLQKAYHRLAVRLNNDWQKRVHDRREWELNKNRRLDWHQRQVVKTEEEYKLIDSLCKNIETDLRITSEDGMREISDALADTTVPIEQYTDVSDWYKPLLTKIIEERRKTPKAERLQRFREDSVDEVDTTDLENWTIRGQFLDEDGQFAAQGQNAKPEDSLSWKLDTSRYAEIQAQQRIQDKISMLYSEEELNNEEEAVEYQDRNQVKEREQREEIRLRRKEKLASMSPEEIRLEKKKEIFKILQEEMKAQTGFQEEERSSQESPSDTEEDDMFERMSADENDPSEYPKRSNYQKKENTYSKTGDSKLFEINLKAERKRFFDRHRIDMAKILFGGKNCSSLREYKKIFKIEMEENPERYSIDTSRDNHEKANSRVQRQAAAQAASMGPVISEEREQEIKTLRKKLDEFIPQIKKVMTNDSQYKNNNEYQRLMNEVSTLEGDLKESLVSYDKTQFDPEIVGEAAAYQDSIQRPPKMVLSPDNLRYLARQMKGLLRMRQFMPDNMSEMDLIKLYGKEKKVQKAKVIIANNEDLNEILSDPAEDIFPADDEESFDVMEDEVEVEKKEKIALRDQAQEKNNLERITAFLGKKVVSDVEGDESKMDFSTLTIINKDVIQEFIEMSDEWIRDEVERLEKEANTLEEKLRIGMTLREKAEYDQHVPFSIVEHDDEINRIKSDYFSRKHALQELEDHEPSEGEEPMTEELKAEFMKDCEISPELEAAYQQIREKEERIFKNQVAEEFDDKEGMYGVIPREEMEEILQQVMDKEGIETEAEATAFFEEQWEKLQPYMMKNNKVVYPKTKWLSEEDNTGFDRNDFSTDTTHEYTSMTLDEFCVDQENTYKAHMWQQERIGRYPQGFRHFENYANYSQVKPGSTIQEYMETMNRACEFNEYVQIMSQHLMEESQTPEFKHEFRSEVLEKLMEEDIISTDDINDLDDDDLRALHPESAHKNMTEFVTSEAFIQECRKLYAAKVQQNLVEKQQFKLVEALEETMDFWRVGSHMFHTPIQNTYIPVRNTIMKKPNLLNEDYEDDEMGYMFNKYDDKNTTRKRLHPMEQLSPLRSNRMGPGISRLTDKYSNKAGQQEMLRIRRSRWRRMSAIQDRGFFTTTNAYTAPLVSSSQGGVSLPMRLMTIPDMMSAFNPFRQ